MLIVRNLLKKVQPDQKVLSGISFQVDEGEFVAVLGASGSGKTMLLRCLALKEKWDAGQYIYNGKELPVSSPLWGWWQTRKEWAFLQENPDVNDQKTAVKNVLAGRWHETPVWRILTGRAATDEHILAMDYLEKVGLLDKAHEKVGKLSGGERQRVAIAKALVKGAKVIFADGPVAGLDPESAQRVMHDLQNVCRKMKVTVICAVPQPEFAEKYASRIWGLSQGTIAFDISGRRLTRREKQLL